MVNPQSRAINLEHFLSNKGYAEYQDATFIRRNPVRFMFDVLEIYENQYPDKQAHIMNFYGEYSSYQNVRLDDIEQTLGDKMITDFKDIIR